MKFSDEVKEAIEKSNLTMTKFSQKTKIKLRTLENWKAGKNEPDEFTKEAFRKLIKENFPKTGYTLVVIAEKRWCSENYTALTTKIKIIENGLTNKYECIKIERYPKKNYFEAIEYFEKKYNLKFDKDLREFNYIED